MKSSSKRTRRDDKIQRLTIRYLQQLTRGDLEALEEFAERRMDWLTPAQFCAEDAVQTALQAIQRGTLRRSGGRRPQLSDLGSKVDFLHFIRSAVNSIIEAAKRNRSYWVIHETVQLVQDIEEEETLVVLTAPTPANEEVAWLDLKNELFARMRKIAPPSLLRQITAWEKFFVWDVELPAWKNRSRRDSVRSLAVQVLKQIAEDFGR